MPDMVLNRTAHLITKSGHVLSFVKGKPSYVPPACVREVIAIGGEHADGEDHPEDFADAPPANTGPADSGERQAQIISAIRKLIERNDRDDFTAAGSPTVIAVKEAVGYKIMAAEISQAWQTIHEQDADPFKNEA